MTGESPDAALVRQQGRALGLPRRDEVYRFVLAAGRPVTVADVAAALPLSPNGVRLHLGTLRDAGLLVERTGARPPRGRPPLVYTARRSALEPDDGYRTLALLLLELHRTGRTPRDAGRAAGGAAAPTAAPGAEPLAVLTTAIEDAGFAPARQPAADGTEELVLQRCPYAAAAAADPATVCALHRGFAEGIAEPLGLEVLGLIARDPHQAGCRLRVRPTRPLEGSTHAHPRTL